MAYRADIEELQKHLTALEQRASVLATVPPDQPGIAGSAADFLRAAARRFPLLALAAAFGLGAYAASRAGR